MRLAGVDTGSSACRIWGRRQEVLHHKPRAMTNITAASTKAEIIDASMELIETQAERITALQERQLILWCLLGIMSILLVLGAH